MIYLSPETLCHEVLTNCEQRQPEGLTSLTPNLTTGHNPVPVHTYQPFFRRSILILSSDLLFGLPSSRFTVPSPA
jgi:hypothetical protein